MSRENAFRAWLVDLTPEKVRLLTKLERATRLVIHVKELTGEIDQKLIDGMSVASKELKDSYEPKDQSK